MANRLKELKSICAVIGIIAVPSFASHLFPGTAENLGSLGFAALSGAIGGAIGVVVGELISIGAKMVSPDNRKGPPDAASSK